MPTIELKKNIVKYRIGVFQRKQREAEFEFKVFADIFKDHLQSMGIQVGDDN